MNNIFRGTPFSHEDKIHENIQDSLLMGRRTKGNLSWRFSFQYHRFDIQGAGFFQTPGVFIDSPGNKFKAVADKRYQIGSNLSSKPFHHLDVASCSVEEIKQI